MISKNNIKKEIKNKSENAADEIKKAADELSDLANQAKNKYQDIDEPTKKKALVAIAGATAVVGAIAGGKKIKEKIKDRD
jgi:uncharacterized membrane-anchored protein